MDTRYRSRTKIDTNVDVAMTPTGAWVGFKLPNIFFHVVTCACGKMGWVPDIRLSGTATKKVPGKECYCFNFP